MIYLEVIGHLGGDAQVKSENGRQYVQFSVSDNQKWTGADGQAHESVSWVSCFLEGDGGKLLQFLKKGRQVFVAGRGAARVYSSEKQRKMVAGLTINVQRVELVGAPADNLPRYLCVGDRLAKVSKMGYLSQQECETVGMQFGQPTTLPDEDGLLWDIDAYGRVFEHVEQNPA